MLHAAQWLGLPLFDDEHRAPFDDAVGAIAFEIGEKTSEIAVVSINKSLSVEINKRFTPGAQEKEKVGHSVPRHQFVPWRAAARR